MIYDLLKPTIGDLNALQEREVCSFVGQTVSAVMEGNLDKVASLVKEAAEGLGEAEAVIAEHVLAKLAGMMTSALGALSTGAAIATIGASLYPAVKHVQQGFSLPSKLETSLRTILREHPELRNDPRTPKYFDFLVTYAPEIAANPTIAANEMRIMQQNGITAITGDNIARMVGIRQGVLTGATVNLIDHKALAQSHKMFEAMYKRSKSEDEAKSQASQSGVQPAQVAATHAGQRPAPAGQQPAPARQQSASAGRGPTSFTPPPTNNTMSRDEAEFLRDQMRSVNQPIHQYIKELRKNRPSKRNAQANKP